MTRTEARSALRATTPVTFYKMGNRGLVLFALLLIMATQPTQAFLNHAAAAGAIPLGAPEKPKRWYEAFKGKEVGAATQLARQATQVAVAAKTGSGTAVIAVTASQYASTALGQYVIALVAITFFIKQILDYGKARMNRQTVKNQLALMEKQMAQQQRMMEMMIEAQARPRGRGRRAPALPSANRLALPAIAAA